jgi:hypothetical protein
MGRGNATAVEDIVGGYVSRGRRTWGMMNLVVGGIKEYCLVLVWPS